MFGASTDAQSLIPLESDEGLVLENKWKKWLQRESFKRSVGQSIYMKDKIKSN